MSGGILKQTTLTAVVLLASTIAAAQPEEPINAGRPGIADGSKVVGLGRFQVELGVQDEFRRAAGVSDHRAAVPLLLRAGIGANWEFRLEGDSYVFQSTRDAQGALTQEEGRAPVAFGAKYQIMDGMGGATPSLGVIARVIPPSGSRSFRTKRTTGDVRLAADWDFAQVWSFNPNVGVGVVEDEAGRKFFTRTFAATLSYNPTPSFGLFMDAGLRTPEKKEGRVAAIIDAGVAYLVTPNVQLDLSAGRGVRGDTSPRAFVSAGISIRF